ncbi:MAG: hypothetical protein H7A33_08130 [Deltaproteobacteria bacterium]|nr:hypothetical protein [Deltaproteobacteria bacterium]
MFRKVIFSFLSVSLLLVGNFAQAQYCGGTVVNDNDCGSNARPFAVSCCPDGYRVQGVAYNDLYKSDYADAVGPVCRHVVKGNDMLVVDFQTSPVLHVCDKTENMVGIACKDMPKKGGKNSDVLDGCTAICKNPKTNQTRLLYSADLAGNGRSYVKHMIDLPQRVVGMAYKDGDWKGAHVGGSDRADCATIVHKYLPIVK